MFTGLKGKDYETGTFEIMDIRGNEE